MFRRMLLTAALCAALAGAFGVSVLAGVRPDMPNAWIPAALCAFGLAPVRSVRITAAAKASCIYVVAAAVSALARTYASVGAWRVSLSLPALGLIATTAAVHRIVRRRSPSEHPGRQGAGRYTLPAAALAATVFLLGVHLVALWALWRCWYGYGGERAPAVMGQTACVLLTAALLWRPLDDGVVRNLTAAAGAAYLLWVAAGA